MRVLIIKPRLDIAFKRSLYIANRGEMAPIREHWERVVDRLAYEHRQLQGHTTRVLEVPAWQISPELVRAMGADLTYVPHKEKVNFDCGELEVRYYMQTVFPWLFTVDPLGWGGGASLHPLQPSTESQGAYQRLVERVGTNESKFQQPERRLIDAPWFREGGFVFFPCQLPHDETIQYHSPVRVEEALEASIRFCELHGLTLVAKGHPVNPASMAPLKAIAKDRAVWVEDISVHDLIEKSRAVFTVNSGVGMEALLHRKPVFRFGYSDYDSVSSMFSLDLDEMTTVWRQGLTATPNLEGFFEAFVSWCVDSSQPLELLGQGGQRQCG